MKVCVVGDVHGRSVWKEVDPEQYDKVVFLGDYLDSFDIKPIDQVSNLIDIIEFKKIWGDKIVLLLGNHDVHYIHSPRYRCSGYTNKMAYHVKLLLKDNKDLFTVAYEVKNSTFGTSTLFTHAGVSKHWYNENKGPLEEVWTDLKGCREEAVTLADVLNYVYKSRYEDILHQVSHTRGGYDKYSGIFWADHSETMHSTQAMEGYHQIVGHTHRPTIETIQFSGLRASVTYCDVLDHQTKFLIREI